MSRQTIEISEEKTIILFVKYFRKKALDTIVDIKNNSTFSSQYMSPQQNSHHYGTQGRKFMF